MNAHARRDRRAAGALVVIFGVAALVLVHGQVLAAEASFSSADAAATALVDAAKAGNREKLLQIFGSEGAEVLPSGDPVADREAREHFVARAAERTHLERVGDDFAVLYVGKDDWPFPIPLMKQRGGWKFDVAAGKVELLNRRVGRNELFTIDICQEYVSAQREYARRRQATDGILEYAQKLRSTPGKHDGLYWEVREGEPESPMGPLFADATREGYHPGASATPEPFHGYLYKALDAAGPHAPGGAGSYIKDGRMTRGFALLAYPVRYGVSGVMTFIVNENGVVFQKDLGPKTAEIAAKTTAYDPDDSWDPAEPWMASE